MPSSSNSSSTSRYETMSPVHLHSLDDMSVISSPGPIPYYRPSALGSEPTDYSPPKIPLNNFKRTPMPTIDGALKGHSLSLREHENLVDRLTKDNWDLKLKVTFLEDALTRRSPEGVKEALDENTMLKEWKAKATKHFFELAKKKKQMESGLKEAADKAADLAKVYQAERDQALEENEELRAWKAKSTKELLDLRQQKQHWQQGIQEASDKAADSIRIYRAERDKAQEENRELRSWKEKTAKELQDVRQRNRQLERSLQEASEKAAKAKVYWAERVPPREDARQDVRERKSPKVVEGTTTGPDASKMTRRAATGAHVDGPSTSQPQQTTGPDSSKMPHRGSTGPDSSKMPHRGSAGAHSDGLTSSRPQQATGPEPSKMPHRGSTGAHSDGLTSSQPQQATGPEPSKMPHRGSNGAHSDGLTSSQPQQATGPEPSKMPHRGSNGAHSDGLNLSRQHSIGAYPNDPKLQDRNLAGAHTDGPNMSRQQSVSAYLSDRLDEMRLRNRNSVGADTDALDMSCQRAANAYMHKHLNEFKLRLRDSVGPLPGSLDMSRPHSMGADSNDPKLWHRYSVGALPDSLDLSRQRSMGAYSDDPKLQQRHSIGALSDGLDLSRQRSMGAYSDDPKLQQRHSIGSLSDSLHRLRQLSMGAYSSDPKLPHRNSTGVHSNDSGNHDRPLNDHITRDALVDRLRRENYELRRENVALNDPKLPHRNFTGSQFNDSGNHDRHLNDNITGDALLDRLRRENSDLRRENVALNDLKLPHRNSTGSHSNDSGKHDRHLNDNGARDALLDRLRRENSELRRENVAQTSMLTSRNREKDRLYQDIEDLRLQARRGSSAGQTGLERAIARRRALSDATDASRFSRTSDPEREAWEIKNGILRDQIAALKLNQQEYDRELHHLLDELEHVDQTQVAFATLRRQHEELQKVYDNDMGLATRECRRLEETLSEKRGHVQRLEGEMSRKAEETAALGREVQLLEERFVSMEGDIRSKTAKIADLEGEIETVHREAEALEQAYRDEKDKNSKLTVQQEGSQNEISFLREEQDGFVIKIGQLEDSVKNMDHLLALEGERVRHLRESLRDLSESLLDEQRQREACEIEKCKSLETLSDVQQELSAAKDEAGELRRQLASEEDQVKAIREHLAGAEADLKKALGEPNGTLASLPTSVLKLQKQLRSKAADLDAARNRVADLATIVHDKDGQLERTALEVQKLTECLERGRRAAEAEKARSEQWRQGHRTCAQKDSRIAELEASRQADRKKLATLEQQSQEQLSERNNLLLSLWKRISAMCGSDWQHQNSLVGHHLPTTDVVANMLPDFRQKLLLAVRTVETVVSRVQSRVLLLESEVQGKCQGLERKLEGRLNNLDRLEASVQGLAVSGAFAAAPEIAKLRGENRLLKSELAGLQNKDMHARASLSLVSSPQVLAQDDSRRKDPIDRVAGPAALVRHHSSSGVEALDRQQRRSIFSSNASSAGVTVFPGPSPAPASASPGGAPREQLLQHRLREMERRVKAEREARLLDRAGARKRLEEGEREVERLKAELERERKRGGGG